MDIENIVTLQEIRSLINVKVGGKRTLGQVTSKDLGSVLKKIVEFFYDSLPAVTAPIKITLSDLIDGVIYINNNLQNTPFTLTIPGRGTLVEGEQYEVLPYPQAGFKLKGIVLSPEEHIILGVSTTGSNVVVQTFADMLELFHGETEITFYVVRDETRNGAKSAYKYIPGFTTSPAILPIDFNYSYDRLSQTIEFTTIPAEVPANTTYVDLVAVSSAGLPITYISSNPEVAVIENGRLRVLKAGTVVITAIQEGNVLYNPAQAVSRTIVITAPPVTIPTAFPYTLPIDYGIVIIEPEPEPEPEPVELEFPYDLPIDFGVEDSGNGGSTLPGILPFRLITT